MLLPLGWVMKFWDQFCYMTASHSKVLGKHDNMRSGLFMAWFPHGNWHGASLVAQRVKNPAAVQETQVWSLAGECLLEKGVTTQSSILAWRIPWTEDPSRLRSMESQRVGHDWATKQNWDRNARKGLVCLCRTPESTAILQKTLRHLLSCLLLMGKSACLHAGLPLWASGSAHSVLVYPACHPLPDG